MSAVAGSPLSVRETATGAAFRVRVVPRAARSGIAGIQDDALRLRITAPPVEGKANEACIRLLADVLGVKRGQVTIIAGHASRTKTVAVTGVPTARLISRIAALRDIREA